MSQGTIMKSHGKGLLCADKTEFYTTGNCMRIKAGNLVSIAVNRHHSHSNSYEGKHVIGAGLELRSLFHYCHGNVHKDMMLGKQLRIHHLDWQAAGRKGDIETALSFENSKPTPCNTLPPTHPYLLQKGHTF